MAEDKQLIDLKFPLTIKTQTGADATVRQVTLHRMKTKHLKLLPESFMATRGEAVNPGDLIPLIAAMSGLSEDAVGEIDVADLMVVAEAIQGFFEAAASPSTGGT